MPNKSIYFFLCAPTLSSLKRLGEQGKTKKNAFFCISSVHPIFDRRSEFSYLRRSQSVKIDRKCQINQFIFFLCAPTLSSLKRLGEQGKTKKNAFFCISSVHPIFFLRWSYALGSAACVVKSEQESVSLRRRARPKVRVRASYLGSNWMRLPVHSELCSVWYRAMLRYI